MSETSGELPSQAQIEILRSAASIVEQLKPAVIQRLGGIATIYYDGPDQTYVHELADIVERADRAFQSIYDAIGEVSTRPFQEDVHQGVETLQADDQADQQPDDTSDATSDNDSEAETVMLDELDLEILAYMREYGEVKMQDIRQDVPAVRDMDDKTYKNFRGSKFAKLRARLVEHLQESDADAAIVIGGKSTRGQTYQLFESDKSQVTEVDEKVNDHEAQVAPVAQESEQVVQSAEQSSESQTARTKALLFLNQTPGEKQSIRDILKAVYGRSRVKRPEELAITSELSQLVEAGVVRRYGKQFELVPESERAAKRLEILQARQASGLTEEEMKIVDYIHENAPVVSKKISVIIQAVYEVGRLEQDDFQRFYSSLKMLVAAGYLAEDSRTIGHFFAGERSLPPLPPIFEVPTADDLEVTQPQADVSEASDTSAVPVESTEIDQQPAGEHLLERLIEQIEHISEREAQMTRIIVETARKKGDDWIAQKEVDLSSVTFASEDPEKLANAQRAAYGTVTKKLVEAGILVDNGKARGGRRYKLASELYGVDDEPREATATSEQTASTPSKPRVNQTPRSQALEREYRFAERSVERAARRREQRRQAEEARRSEEASYVFAGKLIIHVAGLLDAAAAEGGEPKERKSVISRSIAEALGVSKKTAQELVGELVAREHFYVNGTHKGSPLISTEAPKQVEGSQDEKKEKDEYEKKQDRTNLLTEQDVVIAERVFNTILNTLTHVQQGIEINKLGRSLGFEGKELTAFKRSVRKMAKLDMLILEKSNTANLTSDHSRRVEQLLVKLPDQSFKDRLKREGGVVITELREMVGTEV